MLSCFVAVDGLTVLSVIIPLGTFQTQGRREGKKTQATQIPLQVVLEDCPAGWFHIGHLTSDRRHCPQLQRRKKG